ncbi:MAG TPA: RnfABCDGE type electron transport complex subunit D [Acidimicrobiales bacterium]|nr:RnfABCDGE type electron transport complex subunit D [Acidimicrobiales bacterium]
MTAAPARVEAPSVAKTVQLGDNRVPVVGPSRRDPRLWLSAVIMTLHVLGQAVLEFKVSIVQILVTIAVGALVEAAVTLHRHRVLAWPASGILTGSGVAFILRASGTEHGDWWSANGIHFFVIAVLLSLLSKYLVRPGGRHLFNPSNVGLVWALLVIGPAYVFPQYLWWGPSEVAVAVAYGVILLGGFFIVRRVRMVPMVLGFLVPYVSLVGLFALSGRSFLAIWHDGPVSGLAYWQTVALSPEVLVFVFFMMSDPQTAPKSRVGRIVYGAATALVATGLLYFQPTEFGIKLAILSSLTVSCAAVPLIEKLARRMERSVVGATTVAPRPLGLPATPRRLSSLRNPAVVAAVIIASAAVLNTAALAGNEQLILIERGLTGEANAQ